MSCIPENLKSALRSNDADSLAFTQAIDTVISKNCPYDDVYRLLKNNNTRDYYNLVYTIIQSEREETRRREEEEASRREVNIKRLMATYGNGNVWYDRKNVVVNVAGDGKCLLYSILLHLASTNSVNTICNFDDIKSMNDLLVVFSSIINSEVFYDCVINRANKLDDVLKYVFIHDILTSLRSGIDVNAFSELSDSLISDIFDTMFSDLNDCCGRYNKLIRVLKNLHKIKFDICKFDLLNPYFADMFCYASVMRSFDCDLAQQDKLDIVYEYLFNKIENNVIQNHRNFLKIQNVAKKISNGCMEMYSIKPIGHRETLWCQKVVSSVLHSAHYRTIFTIEEFNDRCNNHCFKNLISIFTKYFQEKENQPIDEASLELIKSLTSSS